MGLNTITDDVIGWQVGNIIYNNKWEAVSAYQHSPSDFKFYYYDSNWDKFVWENEPETDMLTLELLRCKEIREKYKIVVLAYSGGVDSHTILTRFIQSNTHIDYIFCLSFSKEGDIETDIAKEYLRQIQHLIPNTKLIFDDTFEIIDNIENKNNNSIFTFNGDITKTNFQLRFHHIGYQDRLKIEKPDLYNYIEENNGCIIIGSNKPLVDIDDKGCAWHIPLDVFDENVQNTHLTEFFWTGSCPILQIKQCHLAKKWLKANKINSANSVYKSTNRTLFTSLNTAFGREPPMSPMFAIKNCFGKITNSEYIRQEYGAGNNFVFSKIMESNRYNPQLKKLHNFIEDLSKSIPVLVNFSNNVTSVHGWYGKARFLGK